VLETWLLGRLQEVATFVVCKADYRPFSYTLNRWHLLLVEEVIGVFHPKSY